MIDQHEGGAAAGLISLLRGPDEWIYNSDLTAAIWPELCDRRPPAATVAQWKVLAERLPGIHTKLVKGRRAVKEERLYSREALVMIGVTGRLPFNDDFRSWLSAYMVKAIHEPRATAKHEIVHLRGTINDALDRVFFVLEGR